MTIGYDFKTAVIVLEKLLNRYEAMQGQKNTPATA